MTRDDRHTLTAGAVRSLGWSAVSFGGGKLALFAATLVLARVLTPEDFGVFAAGLVLVGILEVGLDLGVGAAVIYEQEGGITRRVHGAFTLNVAMALLLTVAALGVAPLLAEVFGAPGHVGVFRAIVATLAIRGLGQVHDAVLQRELDFRRRALALLTRAGVRGVVSVALALAGVGVWALVWGLVAGEVCGTVVNWLLVRLRPRLVLDRHILVGLLRFGTAALLVKAVAWVVDDLDYVVVGATLGPDDLGVYTIAYRLPELVIDNAFWLLSSVAFPLFARAGAGQPDAFPRIMVRMLPLVTVFGFPAGVGMALIAHDAVRVLFGAQWAAAAAPMALIGLKSAAESTGYASGDLYPAMGRPGLLLRVDVPTAIVMVVVLLLAAPWGLTAVAAVHLGLSLLYAVARALVARRVIGVAVRDQLTAMAPAAVVTLGVVAAALPVRMLLAEGGGRLAATIVAGLLGGAVAAWLGAREVVADVARFGRTALRGPAS